MLATFILNYNLSILICKYDKFNYFFVGEGGVYLYIFNISLLLEL